MSCTCSPSYTEEREGRLYIPAVFIAYIASSPYATAVKEAIHVLVTASRDYGEVK